MNRAALNQLSTPEARVKALISLVSKERLEAARERLTEAGELVRLSTRGDAIRWGEQWQAHAEKMQMLYDCACIRAEAAEALLADAQRELARLRAITE